MKKEYILIFFASGLGLGLSPIAPGTCGAILGVIIHILIMLILPSLKLQLLIFFFLLTATANHILTPWAQRYWKSKDPKHFVLDEVAGYLLVPILFNNGKLWQIVLWGFILFRVFDIIKIPPARQIDRNTKGAWGILLDDLVSAVYAVIVLYLLMFINN